MGHMAALPEHYQPSSDARILRWVGVLAALTLGAAIARSRTLPHD